MTVFDWMNARLRRLSIIDIKLAQGAAICLAFALAKVFPQILGLEAFWYIVLAAILGARPVYLFLRGKRPNTALLES